ncbi:MAG: GNAT family N-acetyltransferase, partial [Clostridia bacterium]|nr:GNAT family N-acetyltransferase [Clostridia bacterium]
NMLTSLIQDERKNYNSNINENYEVKNFYEQYIENENMCILVAKENENYMGYIYGFIQENGNLFNNKIAQLDALFVKEQYRGNGIAKSLMKEFINWSKEKGATYVELSVCKDNTNAISLYEDEGFYIDKILLKKKL